MKYYTGAAWADVPTKALYSTYRGTCHVSYPQAADFDGAGAPCGAVGRPTIIIESPWLTDEGLAFWRAFFATPTETYADIQLMLFDVRTGANNYWAGKLNWPTFASSGVGSTASRTAYRDVRILITDCVELVV